MNNQRLNNKGCGILLSIPSKEYCYFYLTLTDEQEVNLSQALWDADLLAVIQGLKDVMGVSDSECNI